MTEAASAFPFVYFAGLALFFSPNRAAKVSAFFLCVAGLVGTWYGMTDGEFGAALLLVGGLVVCVPLAYWLRRKRGARCAAPAVAPCPECGRMNAQTTRICPRCDHRLESSDAAG